MSYSDTHIVETYIELLDGLSNENKKVLINNLSKSLKIETDERKDTFYKSFGSFGSNKKAEHIIEEIRANRSFKNKDLLF